MYRLRKLLDLLEAPLQRATRVDNGNQRFRRGIATGCIVGPEADDNRTSCRLNGILRFAPVAE